MQTDRSAQRIAAFSLGTAAIFDLTGAAIYRILRRALPAPPPESAAGAFRESAATLREARREAVAAARGGRSPFQA
jgi:hypothetical protein